MPADHRGAPIEARTPGFLDEDTSGAEPAAAAPSGNRSPTLADANVGGRIKELRRAAGRTQKEAADIVGVTGAQFHRYETGATRIATSRLLGIANALGVRPEALVGTAAPRAEPLAEFTDGATDELIELVQVFSTINDPRRRSALMAFARAVARGQPLQSPGSGSE
ncbi:helix-turn-helix domain-containing protein [Falsiroseomonas tokyonensis]|uniref:Helix-turn-helix domain-containing protein n=1 Tax=Falsiroseomonas tokyonensis TaxID=430521 RepID=A0ABV7BQK0_9PROT|nr:helix-turn-helix domain-containing protein [Falsiroseomonas tokyonensis]MBU8536746.1 helix-turn-helix domain-containing protein [Falsiroseomonas tokyonensis]